MVKNEVRVNDLMDSKIYVRGGIGFMSPKELVGGFVDVVNDGDYEVQVQNPVINQNEDGKDNIAYPRFMVEARKELVDFGKIQYQNTLGILVAMDQQNPMIKIYSGMNVTACMNMSIFNAEHVYYQNLFDDIDKVWNQLDGFVSGIEAKIKEYRKKHELMVNTIMTNDDVNRTLGYLLRNAVDVRLGTSPVVNAAKLMDDKKSVYHFDETTNLYNVYNAVTQSITDTKDIFYRPDKTIGLSKLLLPNAA